MNANIQIQKKGTYLIDICGFHLDYMKGPFYTVLYQKIPNMDKKLM